MIIEPHEFVTFSENSVSGGQTLSSSTAQLPSEKK